MSIDFIHDCTLVLYKQLIQTGFSCHCSDFTLSRALLSMTIQTLGEPPHTSQDDSYIVNNQDDSYNVDTQTGSENIQSDSVIINNQGDGYIVNGQTSDLTTQVDSYMEEQPPWYEPYVKASGERTTVLRKITTNNRVAASAELPTLAATNTRSIFSKI